MSNKGERRDADPSSRTYLHRPRKDGAALADEMLYCERCGISFLWTVEEHTRAEDDGMDTQAAQRSPRFCPGCRVLLPVPPRERGLVKWYNIRKRYGFVVRLNQPDIFVPAASLRGTRFLQTGDLVEFAVGANAEGPIAEDVRVLASGGT